MCLKVVDTRRSFNRAVSSCDVTRDTSFNMSSLIFTLSGTTDELRLDRIILGFGFAGVLWTLWWNLDYLRFMKFWVKPPYKHRTVIIFRILFALCFLSAVRWFVGNLLRSSRPPRAYVEALAVGIAWCFAIWAMVNMVEWVNRKRQ